MSVCLHTFVLKEYSVVNNCEQQIKHINCVFPVLYIYLSGQ